MNRSYKWPLLFSFFILFFICLPILSPAQGGGIGDPCDYNDPDAIPCPIDGGLGVLIVIGVGYGIKKVKDIRENA